jgi:hypothetical protein
MRKALLLGAFFIIPFTFFACGGGGSTSTDDLTISGSVVDGYVSGATVSIYDDLFMQNQIGTGTSDSNGNFTITLSGGMVPDPVHS